MEAGTHRRVKCRLAVDLFCPERGQHRRSRISDISLGGMFVIGLPCFRLGQEVQVVFGHAQDGALSLRTRVARIALDGAALKLDAPSPTQVEGLRGIINPEWRGGDLLQGVLILSSWVETEQFSDWLRLLTLLEHWQRATVPARRELSKSRLPDSTVVPPADRLVRREV